MSHVEVTKSIFGKLKVHYDCPNCKERLTSPLNEAGNLDSCPNCHAQFAVPGTDALNSERQRQHTIQAQKEAERERKAEQLRQKQERENLEKLRLAAEQRIIDEKRQQREHENAPEIQPDTTETEQFLPASQKKSRTHRSTAYIVLAIVAFFVISILYSAFTSSGAGITDVVHSASLRAKLKQCPTYGVIETDAYYNGLIATNEVVFDLLDGGSATARRIDPVHLLMQFCDEIDLNSIHKIILARNGTHKFYISGSDMKPLAESYANGGRPWAFNHLPESLRTMSGLRAYDQWSGGWLGVLQEQTEDLNDFLNEWLNSSLSSSIAYNNINNRNNRPAFTREQVRDTLREMEDNVPDTLREMESNVPDVIENMREHMIKDAEKYGLSKSDVELQLRDIEAAARDQIRGMESDVRKNIRNMEDDVLNQLNDDGFNE